MGCFGMGVSRLLAVVAEEFHDDKGLAWPAVVAPFDVHLLALGAGRSPAVAEAADRLYRELSDAGADVLYDDRDVSPGVKFADADLLGLPVHVVVGSKGLARGVVEWRTRSTGDERERRRRRRSRPAGPASGPRGVAGQWGIVAGSTANRPPNPRDPGDRKRAVLLYCPPAVRLKWSDAKSVGGQPTLLFWSGSSLRPAGMDQTMTNLPTRREERHRWLKNCSLSSRPSWLISRWS